MTPPLDSFGHQRRLLAGLGRFTEDIAADQPLHMVIRRSFHAHAILDTLAPRGVADIAMPASPHQIW
ncbi:hypothetical protein ACQW02_18170 [Humitalea sp. 24SJ18S-53]|uniref:hypothetical protein n=1 Tax=Humitalea sp. 24SJ18S-53 TaxID=3422307 RepID=UPI003D67A946